jgi:hypothetical protein
MVYTFQYISRMEDLLEKFKVRAILNNLEVSWEAKMFIYS